MGTSAQGLVLSLNLNAGDREPVKRVQSATFVAGMGIEGDRHATDREERQDYQVLLMDQETLRELGLEPGTIKENVTSSGIDVSSLGEGQQLALGGETVIRVSKPCAPCSRIEEIRPGLQGQLEGRRGMLASIVTGGTVRVGDAIRLF